MLLNPATESEAWLVLSLLPGLGAVSIARRVAAHGSAHAALASLDLPDFPAELARALEEIRQADAEGRYRVLCPSDSDWPTGFEVLHDPPPVLYARGDPAVLRLPQVAVVGARHASPAGLARTRQWAGELARAGLCVASGLALGVDAAAHEGALASGATLAVMGTGIDRIYPARHADLARRIERNGCLITELPPGTRPTAHGFPRRNRLVAALARVTVVMEAAADSGSLITARLAAEYGREVWAVAGSPENPGMAGCHALIREGAGLALGVHDLLLQYGHLHPTGLVGTSLAAVPLEARPLWNALPDTPAHPGQLAALSGLPLPLVMAMALQLELSGHLLRLPDGTLQRAIG